MDSNSTANRGIHGLNSQFTGGSINSEMNKRVHQSNAKLDNVVQESPIDEEKGSDAYSDEFDD